MTIQLVKLIDAVTITGPTGPKGDTGATGPMPSCPGSSTHVIFNSSNVFSASGDFRYAASTLYIDNSSGPDSRSTIEVYGNSTSGRGVIEIKGKHDGFDGTQNGDGGSIFRMIHNAASANPQKMTWTSYNGGIKLDVENNGSGGSITGFVKFTKEGYVRMTLPTSSAGLPGGTLWNDGGVVKIT